MTENKHWHRMSAKQLGLFLLCILLLLLLISCRFVAHTQIQPDGSGVVREAHVYDKTEGETPQETCKKAAWHSQPGAATFTEEEHHGQIYCERSRAFSSIQELKQFYEAWDGEYGSHISVNTLQLENEQFSFDVTIDVSNIFDSDTVGIYEVQLTPPGTLEYSNADQQNGQKLIWTVYPGSTVTLRAGSFVASPPPATAPPAVPRSSALQSLLKNPTLLLIVGVAFLGACIIAWGAVVLMKRRSPQQEQTSRQTKQIAGIEQRTKQLNQKLAELFKDSYSGVVSDLDAINQLKQTPGLTKEQKQLLYHLEACYLHNTEQNVTAAYEALLATLAAQDPKAQDSTQERR